MAADLSQDAVLRFLRSRGGSAKNAELLLHFRAFLRDHEDRERNREQFKKFVNSVATVRQEDGVNHVILRRRFRGCVPGQEAGPDGLQAPRRGAPGPAHSGTCSPTWSRDKPRPGAPHRRQAPGPGPEEPVLPAAGIIPTSNLEHHRAHLGPGPGLGQGPEPEVRRETTRNPDHHRTHLGPEPEVRRETTRNPDHHRTHLGPRPGPEPEVRRETILNLDHHRTNLGPRPGPEPEVRRETILNLDHHRTNLGPGPEPEVRRETILNLDHHRTNLGPGPGPEVGKESNLNPDHHRTLLGPGLKVYTQTPYVGQPGPDPAVVQQQCPGPVVGRGRGLQREEELLLSHTRPRRLRHRKSYKSAVSVDEEEEEEEEQEEEEQEEEEAPRRLVSVGGAGPLSFTEAPPPSSSHQDLPQIFIQDVDEGRDLRKEVSVRRSLPLEAELCGAAQRAGPLTRLSPSTPSSHGTTSSLSSEDGRSLGSRGGAWSSCDDLHTGTGDPGGGATHGGGPSSQWRRSAGLHDNQEALSAPVAFHRSLGDLYGEEGESSGGSASSLVHMRPPVSRRRSSNVRSRMCRSLGSDLDQLLREEEESSQGGGSEAARRNRLHLLSSSLSLPHHLSSSSLSSCSTPPPCPIFSDLVEGTARRRSLPDADGSTRASQVPLESREHDWLVKSAAGAWPDIYSLFREDSSLLNRRDFISGFTVLHWIAKHGDHRVLNTLWYGVEKAGLTFDINAQSSCGHTPLHIAAIHNHKNVIRLLVNKFSADLRRRDTSGKRAWQYLGHNATPELFKLLGAPPRTGQGVGQQEGGQQPQRRHRRRHHFSMAGQKPLNLPKVKRSSSIAAFLKHKSIQRLTQDFL